MTELLFLWFLVALLGIAFNVRTPIPRKKPGEDA